MDSGSYRVVLFGASGFIGAHVRRSLSTDPRVSFLDCPGRDRYDLLTGTVDELTAVLLRARPDAVVACTGQLTGSVHDLLRANALPAAALVEAVSAAAPGARLVRLGSAAEYGPVPAGHAVAEDHPPAPVSGYGLSHLTATRLLELASADGRVDGVTLRVFNPIGPGLREDTLLGRAVALLRHALDRGEDTVTLGDLTAYRDFVDVRDVAAAVCAAVFAPSPAPRVVNVGSGHAVPARAAVDLLAAAAGFTGRVVERGAGPARSSAVGWMLADIGRAARDLGWAPVHD
ncbi:MAG TPA: NAD-dependent epimerase/dehydratase family protein, partial [Pilimelia sp.]|nr:NAD-dependent epimerase/dehydratase family protein [Pilimelia sp.]